MLVAGTGLGVILVAVAVSVLTGAADHETGMLSGLNTTGHEIGGSLVVAQLAERFFRDLPAEDFVKATD